MLTGTDHWDRLFATASQTWNLPKLYADLEAVAGKPLKPHEKACLRGLLCRYRPGEIASACAWTAGALRVELNKGLYRYIESLTGNPVNSLRWEKVSEWLELKGYKLQTPAPPTPTPCIDWGTAPEISLFFGRTEDLSKLAQWITGDRIRLLVIYGMGGVGKTAFAVKLAERVCSDFASLHWRSLKNAQPLTLLIGEILRQQSADLSALVEFCKQSRRLLVLDDFETVLQDGELVGLYRQGYQPYGELIHRFGCERHQSCLIVISREQPKELCSLQGDDLPVRSHKLGGLKRQGAIALLQSRGFAGNEPGLAMLVEQYRGNPAALKIVAGTIKEIFDGNVNEFLKQTGLALGDTLRNLIYGQFERLSVLEKDIMYCLALKRCPTSLAELRQDLCLDSSGSDLIDALQSLTWRALIEKSTEQGQVVLQLEPVVQKYVQRKFVEELTRELEQLVQRKQVRYCPLLKKHPLVEDSAPEGIRAVQIRLVLKPIKDQVSQLLGNLGDKQVIQAIADDLTRYGGDRGYWETNLALLGLWY
jgi:hypothetical protein